MKTTIEKLDFPSKIKKKLKIKVNTSSLKLEFLPGHIIAFNQTNLSVRKPHRIIARNNNKVLIALMYDDNDKVYLPNQSAIISFTKYVFILNQMNNDK